METKELIEIAGLLLTNAISFGVLKGRVSSLSERLQTAEKKIEMVDEKVNLHSVSMAEVKSDMKHVMDKLTSIEEKLDKVLTGGK